jgi:hypothetical protein
MPMNPDIKTQWVAALRSGEYTQGFNYLTTVNADGTEKDCCWGVLCKLAVKAEIIPSGVRDIIEIDGCQVVAYGDERITGLPPAEVMIWAGIPDGQADAQVNFCAPGDSEARSAWLATINDRRDVPFTEIADLIENQL